MSSQTNQHTVTKWTQLNGAVVDISNLVIHSLFMVPVNPYGSKPIYKYDPIYDAWNEWIKYPPILPTGHIVSCVECTAYVLYFYDRHAGVLIELNIETHATHVIKDLVQLHDPRLACIGDEVHMFGSTVNHGFTKHFIFDKTQQQFVVIHEFDKRITGFGLSYLSKKNELLLFGGYNWTCWKYHAFFESFSTINKTYRSELLLYPEHLQKRMCFGWVLTHDETLLITCGGWVDPGKDVDDISVLNLQTMIWNTCTIKCPIKSSNFRLDIIHENTRTNLIAFGYIRELWQTNTFCGSAFPPNDVIQSIQTWISDEMLHLIDGESISVRVKKHWKIRVNDILNHLERHDDSPKTVLQMESIQNHVNDLYLSNDSGPDCV
eukprot:39744_1